MISFLSDLPVFVEVARLSSFTKAAEALDIAVSTVSRKIRLVEESLGTPLFLRNTHVVRLTEAGQLLLEHCEFILASTDAAMDSVRKNTLHPFGRVRVSMYGDTYHESMAGVFNAFADAWPDIDLSVRFSEDAPDLFVEPYDVSFRTGPLPDSSAIARKVFTIHPALYASPKLLDRFQAPETPEDLLSIPCIALARFGNVWELRSDTERSVVHITPRFVFSGALLMREFILGGHGVGLLKQELAEPFIENGQMIRLLPQWNGPEHDLFILVCGREIPRRVKIFVDHVLTHFARDDDAAVNQPTAKRNSSK